MAEGVCVSELPDRAHDAQLRGFVEEVRVEGLLAQVRLRIGDQTLTAVITRDAVEELGLAPGIPAVATIKATSVMVSRDEREIHR